MIPRFTAASCGFYFDLFYCFFGCRGLFFLRGEKGCCGFFSEGEEEEEEETKA